MTVKEIAFGSEDTCMKSWATASLALAINEAIFQGGYEAKEYEGAMFLLVRLANEIKDETRDITDSLFDVLKEERKVKTGNQNREG